MNPRRSHIIIALIRTAAVLLFLAPVCIAIRLRWFSSQGTILFGTQARDIFSQCSRNSPKNANGYYLPRSGDIKRLEAGLPAYLSSSAFRDQTTADTDLPHYYLQYAGFIRDGQRMIYANAFPKYNWHQEYFGARFSAHIVCDGWDYFGFEYDPASAKFSALEFNGSL